jgi:Domain of unknown function (DUF5615)
MLRLATDADFNGKALSGIRAREPSLDIVSVHEVGLSDTPDPEILEWSAAEGRILISHDRNTMRRFANERVAANLRMPGVFIIRNTWNRISLMIDEILIVALCSDQYEWADQVIFLPL